MATIKQLMEDKEVKFIRNSKAPAGCFVEFLRNDKGEVVQLKTTFTKGNSIIELNDHKSKLIIANSETWEKYWGVEVSPNQEQNLEQKKVVTTKIVTQQVKKPAAAIIPTPAPTSDAQPAANQQPEPAVENK